jgi:hypothetical protein
MDQVFYLASRTTKHHLLDRSKNEEQFYSDHAFERVRHVRNAISKLHSKLVNIVKNRDNAILTPRNYSTKN